MDEKRFQREERVEVDPVGVVGARILWWSRVRPDALHQLDEGANRAGGIRCDLLPRTALTQVIGEQLVPLLMTTVDYEVDGFTTMGLRCCTTGASGRDSNSSRR